MNITERARNIISSPNSEWTVISAETPNRREIIGRYVVPLAALAALATFIGSLVFGTGAFGVRFIGLNWALFQAINSFISSIVSVFITAFVVDLLAPSFQSQKNFDRSLQLVAYSYTPVWVGGLLAIFPPIQIIGALFGLYGLYLMYVGLLKIKQTPPDKHVGYFVASIIVTIIVYIVIGWILYRALAAGFGTAYYANPGGPANP